MERFRKKSFLIIVNASSNEASNQENIPSEFHFWSEKNSINFVGSQKPPFLKNIVSKTIFVSVGFFVVTTLFLTPRSAKASPLTSGPPGVMLMNEQTNSNIEDLNNKKLALLKSAEENLITLTERLEKMKELSLTFHEYRQTFYRLLDSTSEELFKSIFPGEDIRNLSQLQQKLMKPEFQTLKNEISEEKSEKIEVLEFLSRKTIYFGRLNARMQQTDHKLFQLQQKFVKIESVFKRAILEHDFLNTVPLEKCEQLKRELKEHERVLFGENGLHKDFFLLKKKNFSGEYIHE
jgi:hypothetical protein